MAKWTTRKIVKLISILIGSFAILLISFHFWVLHHAEDIIAGFVESNSNGKLKLQVKKFKFNWFGNKMELENAVFYTPDSNNTTASYRFSVPKMKLKVRSTLPFIFNKQIFINELLVANPIITVTRLRKSADSTNNEPISVPQEMGRIYNSIQDAINVLKIQRFEISNAQFILINKIDRSAVPVHISKIDFHVDNFTVDSGKLTGKEKIFFSDNIMLNSSQQAILFPDGRHRLSFANFRINIAKKIVEFDSCTIAASKKDKEYTGFSIFCDTLKLTNIDFDALYKSSVIKADSVYCSKPQFTISVNLDERKNQNKERPSLEKLIQQLTGDLLLNFIVVNNADFKVNIIKNGKLSSFNSNGNNFEMQGLSIAEKNKQNIRVQKMAMAIRNYETFMKDSLYSFRFDSILINNDKVYLNNFSFKQLNKEKIPTHFKIPKLQLSGLSWDDLLFEQKIIAKEALLINPTINYTDATNGKQTGKKAFFNTLAGINRIFQLNNLSITNGSFQLQLSNAAEIKLTGVSLSAESKNLLRSNKLGQIKQSINRLSFANAVFAISNNQLLLKNAGYDGKSGIYNVEELHYKNNAMHTNVSAKNVQIDELQVDENTGNISLEKLHWKEAKIHIDSFVIPKRKPDASAINVNNISGLNTSLSIGSGNKSMSVYLDSIYTTDLMIKPGQHIAIKKLHSRGNNFSFNEPCKEFRINSFSFTDEKKAALKQVFIGNSSWGNNTSITIPSISFIPFVQQMINGSFVFNDVMINNPEISINNINDSSRKEWALPNLNINKAIIKQPVIHVTAGQNNSATGFNWIGNLSAFNNIELSKIKTTANSLQIDEAAVSANNFSFLYKGGKNFNSTNGAISAQLQNINLIKANNQTVNWLAQLKKLVGKNFAFNNIITRNDSLNIASFSLESLGIHGDLFKKGDFTNTALINNFSGNYSNAQQQINWQNMNYNFANKQLAIQNLSLIPLQTQNDFFKTSLYQTDYFTARANSILLNNFNLYHLYKTKILKAGIFQIDHLTLSAARDKRLPSEENTIKSLLTDKIKSIPFKFHIDSLLLKNSNISYTEIDAKRKIPGIVSTSTVNALIFPIKNIDIKTHDSLKIIALGNLFDTIQTAFAFQQSYADPAAGFKLNLSAKKSDAKVLNVMLPALAAIKINSGILDSLTMQVIGNDSSATGKMYLDYHNLRAEIFKPNGTKMSGFVNFIANSLFLKNKSKGKMAKVFFVRNKNKSLFNYWVKILTSGVLDAVGVKKLVQKRQAKQ